MSVNDPHAVPERLVTEPVRMRRRPVIFAVGLAFLIGIPIVLYAFLRWGDPATVVFPLIAMPLWGGLAMLLGSAETFADTPLWIVVIPLFLGLQVALLALAVEGSARIVYGIRIRRRRAVIRGLLLVVILFAVAFVGVRAGQLVLGDASSLTDEDIHTAVAAGRLAPDACTDVQDWVACTIVGAAAQRDVTVCDALPAQVQLACVSAVAVVLDSSEPCQRLAETLERAACVGALAAEQDDPSRCTDDLPKDQRAMCQRSAARIVCDQNPLLAIRTVCADNQLAAWGLSPRTGVTGE